MYIKCINIDIVTLDININEKVEKSIRQDIFILVLFFFTIIYYFVLIFFFLLLFTTTYATKSRTCKSGIVLCPLPNIGKNGAFCHAILKR